MWRRNGETIGENPSEKAGSGDRHRVGSLKLRSSDSIDTNYRSKSMKDFFINSNFQHFSSNPIDAF